MNRETENHNTGDAVYFTWLKGSKVRSGVITEIHGNETVVKQNDGNSHWLYKDEIWSTPELAKKYPAR